MKLGVVLALVVLLGCAVEVVTWEVAMDAVEQTSTSPGGPAAVDCVYQQVGCVLAVMAETLEDHVWGARLNDYDPHDLVVQKAYQQWLADCGGSPCSDMVPGNLQCVKFVEGVFALANDPLPFHHDALVFWSDYASLPGWSEIKSTSYPPAERGWPAPGDLVIWADDLPNGQPDWSSPGHIAVAVKVTRPDPKHGTSGQLVVAQGNGPGNLWNPNQGLPGNLYVMNLDANKTVFTWGGFTVIGFIRQNQPPTGMPTPVPTSPYLQTALDDAAASGIPGGYYVAQIQQESGFNPAAVSPVGAEGIAQFLPSTAAGWNPPFDPFDPVASLNAGAEYMTQDLNQYAGDYAAALAAYNAGPGTLQTCMQQAGVSWLNCMPAETRHYVQVIFGWN